MSALSPSTPQKALPLYDSASPSEPQASPGSGGKLKLATGRDNIDAMARGISAGVSATQHLTTSHARVDVRRGPASLSWAASEQPAVGAVGASRNVVAEAAAATTAAGTGAGTCAVQEAKRRTPRWVKQPWGGAGHYGSDLAVDNQLRLGPVWRTGQVWHPQLGGEVQTRRLVLSTGEVCSGVADGAADAAPDWRIGAPDWRQVYQRTWHTSSVESFLDGCVGL